MTCTDSKIVPPHVRPLTNRFENLLFFLSRHAIRAACTRLEKHLSGRRAASVFQSARSGTRKDCRRIKRLILTRGRQLVVDFSTGGKRNVFFFLVGLRNNDTVLTRTRSGGRKHSRRAHITRKSNYDSRNWPSRPVCVIRNRPRRNRT